jgi:hypothetical protein
MEVHHPHHPTHKKKWSEYIIEFVMLFAAVTLGFLAENLREHQIMNHRVEQNKIAILKDLQTDSADIAAVIAVEDSCIKRYNRINNYLYLAKTNRISQGQLIDSIKNTPQFIAYSTTLYMNNSSFKNMQSSGLLSYLEDGELKNALANYYEVNFKSIEAANEFFDQVGIVFNNYFPIGLGKLIRDYQKFSNEYELNDSNSYQNFMLSLNKTKKDISSDEFIYEVQKYYNYLFIYRTSLLSAKKSNDKLIKLLRSEMH